MTTTINKTFALNEKIKWTNESLHEQYMQWRITQYH